MVKNAELWELARKIESFVGFTEDVLADPTLVDLFTQIIELRVDAEKVQGEIGGYRQNVDNHITEILDFRTTTTQKQEGLQKENENLRAELVVLCQVVATLSSNRVESSKVKIPEPKAFVAPQGMLKNWKISSGTWNCILLLQGCLTRKS